MFVGADIAGTPFAHGGVAPAGRPALVGERGPEVFIPGRASRVIPNDEIRFGPGAGTGGSGGSGATFNVDLRGADKDAVIRLEKFVKALDANFEKRSVSAVQQARFANPRLFG